MMRMSDLTPEQRAELTFDTTLTFDDVWRSLGSEWLPKDLRALICRTIVRLPTPIADFASRNGWRFSGGRTRRQNS